MDGPDGGLPITVGVGGPSSPVPVIDFAAREAALRGRALRLVQVADEDTAASPRGARAALTLYAELVRGRFPQLGVCVEVGRGLPAPYLAALSRESAMVVVGHGRPWGAPWLAVRSVALQVIAAAQCPAAVVRGYGVRGGPVVAGVRRLAEDRAVVAFAAGEAALRGVPLDLLHADPRPQVLTLGMAPPGLGALAAQVRDGREALDAAARRWSGRCRGLEVRARRARSGAGGALRAAGEDAGILVVGHRRRALLPRVLLGSVSARTVHDAPCPVVVVPDR